MVRLLLRWTFPTMFLAVPACVLPIGPEFQDPSPAPNYEPFFVDIFPDAEGIHQLLPPDKFVVTLGDPNPADKLTVRWVANYPPYAENATFLIGEAQMPLMQASAKDTPKAQFTSPPLTCEKFPLLSDKNLVVLVSDRGFIKPENATDKYRRFSYKDDGTSTKAPTQTQVIAGWRIGGCQ